MTDKRDAAEEELEELRERDLSWRTDYDAMREHLEAKLADRETELASIRRHLGGHCDSQLDGANGLAQATYSAMRRAEARVVELEAERDALRACHGALIAAASELLEVADLRGDSDLPHPADDPELWTARMQTAWDDLRGVLTEDPSPAP